MSKVPLLVNDHGVHADFCRGCRMRKIVVVDSSRYIFCVSFVTLIIYEEAHGVYGLYAVAVYAG